MPIALPVRGRGAGVNPAGRFEPLDFAVDGDFLDSLDDDDVPAPKTRFFADQSKSIISYNDSPDLPFDVSINAYRGCEHGCPYCYARPYHEFLGFSAGVDFETVIFVKPDAPKLLRDELSAKKWRPQTLAMSGITDAYQPVESRLRLSRQCLEVLLEFRNPVGIITKNHRVTRDLDLISELAKFNAAKVSVTITTLDAALSAKLEPRASSPKRRLDAIRQIAAAGVPVGVNVSPIVPGLNDHEAAAILQAAADAGASFGGFIPLRLPGNVRVVFEDWLRRSFPDRYDKVMNRLRSMKNGRVNDPRFGHRFKGDGPFYEQLRSVFDVYRRRFNMTPRGPTLSTEHFRRPGRQLDLFANG